MRANGQIPPRGDGGGARAHATVLRAEGVGVTERAGEFWVDRFAAGGVDGVGWFPGALPSEEEEEEEEGEEGEGG